MGGAGSLGRDDGRTVLSPPERVVRLLPRLGFDQPGELPVTTPAHDHVRSVLAERGACLFRELAEQAVTGLEVLEAFWDLLWAGMVGTFGPAPPARRSLPGQAAPRSLLAVLGPPRGEGRWSQVGCSLAGTGVTATRVAVTDSLVERGRALRRGGQERRCVPAGRLRRRLSGAGDG